jgi:hypothetical protein
MSDLFSLAGSYDVTPNQGAASMDPTIDSPISETLQLNAKHYDEVHLSTDAATTVPFGTVANAHVVLLKAEGGPCIAKVTSAAGSAQSIPFDTFLILMSVGSPITAIALTRSPAVDTTVRVFLGEKA